MKRKTKYWNKMAAFLSGELSGKDKDLFASEIDANTVIKDDYKLMKMTWKDFVSNPDKKYSNTNEAWEKLNWKMEKEGMNEIHNSTSRQNTLQVALRIAAIAILILAVGIPTLHYTSQSKANSQLEYHCEEGTLTVDLPDGSRVFLNEGANLKYEKDFEEKRDVELQGEGYFDVMSDPKRPFQVNNGKVVVTVLGTSFNIRPSLNKSIEVYVNSGLVKVELSETEEKLLLEPGQVAVANDKLSLKQLENDNYLSWKTKDFKFIDTPVMEILHILETSYHVEVDTREINIAGRRLTTEYSDQSFDAILETICTALDIVYSKEDKVYILESN